jgi:hypothetical protein
MLDLVTLELKQIPRNLLGRSFDDVAEVFVFETQSYAKTAATAVHEGVHALGVAGSRRAEVMARIAEAIHQGQPITPQLLRQIVCEVREIGTYNSLPWRLNKTSPHFPGVEF